MRPCRVGFNDPKALLERVCKQRPVERVGAWPSATLPSRSDLCIHLRPQALPIAWTLR
jgi:hypothetical protein